MRIDIEYRRSSWLNFQCFLRPFQTPEIVGPRRLILYHNFGRIFCLSIIDFSGETVPVDPAPAPFTWSASQLIAFRLTRGLLSSTMNATVGVERLLCIWARVCMNRSLSKSRRVWSILHELMRVGAGPPAGICRWNHPTGATSLSSSNLTFSPWNNWIKPHIPLFFNVWPSVRMPCGFVRNVGITAGRTPPLEWRMEFVCSTGRLTHVLWMKQTERDAGRWIIESSEEFSNKNFSR